MSRYEDGEQDDFEDDQHDELDDNEGDHHGERLNDDWMIVMLMIMTRIANSKDRVSVNEKV